MSRKNSNQVCLRKLFFFFSLASCPPSPGPGTSKDFQQSLSRCHPAEIKAMKVFQSKWVWIGVLVAAIFLGAHLQDAWRWNSRALLFLKDKVEPIVVTASGCDHIWLAAAETGKRGDLAGQRHIWEQALGCSPGNLSLLRIVMPQDVDMARLATQRYPDSSKAWFWLGEAIAPSDHMGARQAYLHTVALAPHDGLAWCRLGSNHEQDSEFEKASDAFLNCCYYGDPGVNGCYGAGRMMERLGYPQQAIEYYRLSRWEGALKRADELEKQLRP